MLKCSLVPKVLGRQTPAFKCHCRACLEAQGMKAPRVFTHSWRWVGRWELKVLILDPVTSCPRCCGWFSPTPFNGNTIILGVWGSFCWFTGIQCETEAIWLVSCRWAACQSRWMCCALAAVSWYCRSNCDGLFVLFCSASSQNGRLCSGDDKFGEPQWFDGNSYTFPMWGWIHLVTVVGFAAPTCCWAMEKLADVRAERGLSTKYKSSAVL